MSVWRLVLQEILHRKLNFFLALLSVIVAVGALIGMLLILERHRLATQQGIDERQKVALEKSKELQNEIRKATKGLGFNLRILPKDVNIAEYYAKGYSEQTMPESYVSTLANSKIVSVNHLLPILQQKVEWPELKLPFQVLLVGTRGEVAFKDRDPKKPLQDLVPTGTIVLGQELHRELVKQKGKNVKKGDYLQFQGQQYMIHEIKPKRGNIDDITLWMNLIEAQTLLKKEDRISGILALGCNCEATRLVSIRKDIQSELPEAQVDEHTMIATPRAKLRLKAAKDAKLEKESFADQRAKELQIWETFSAVAIPLCVIGCAVWLGLTALANVRERRSEIGILRALGLRSWQVLMLFLSKAFIIGLLGALLGVWLSWLSISLSSMSLGGESGFAVFLKPLLFGVTILVAPIVCLLASWLPALFAARQDPAVVLRDQ